MNYPKADTGKRIVAAILDSLLAMVAFILVFSILGFVPILGGLFRIAAGLLFLAYMTFKDAIPLASLEGASPGKKLVGMKAVKADGSNCDYLASVKRNLPFVIPSVLIFFVGSIPLLGQIFAVLISIAALAIGIIELARVLTENQGLRFGDMFATTQVVEFRHLDSETLPPLPE